jgi:hypothetical protein
MRLYIWPLHDYDASARRTAERFMIQKKILMLLCDYRCKSDEMNNLAVIPDEQLNCEPHK